VSVPLQGVRLGDERTGFVMVEWRAAADGGDPPLLIAPLHVHHEDDEAWYVLEGRLGFRLGDELVEAGAGEAVMARAGTPHTYWNASTGPTRYLLVMAPRILALIDAIHAASDRSRPALAGLFERYRSELL
jgi:mannose-6-phosphate isomerase-like protein (cupin superfamily)